jgi:hypothetical protein
VQLGPENPIATVLIALMSAAWLVAIWAILRMQLSALKKRGSLWLFGSSVPLASYNRNASRLFAASLLFAIAVAILLFALTSAGYIPRNRVGAPSRDSTSMPLGRECGQRSVPRDCECGCDPGDEFEAAHRFGLRCHESKLFFSIHLAKRGRIPWIPSAANSSAARQRYLERAQSLDGAG